MVDGWADGWTCRLGKSCMVNYFKKKIQKIIFLFFLGGGGGLLIGSLDNSVHTTMINGDRMNLNN